MSVSASCDKSLTLRETDPAVQAARRAEVALFRVYGLTPKENYLDMDFGRLRVLTFGSGEPLLLVPGNTGDVFPLASLIAELTGRMVIAVNRPGGGLSEGMDHRRVNIRNFAVDTLVAVLDAFDLQKVPVVGHSMGAHWSLWLALDRPERVSHLITMGNPGNVMLDQLPKALALMGKSPWNRWLLKLIAPRSAQGAKSLFKMMGMDAAGIARLAPELLDCYYRFCKLPHYVTSSTSLMENLAPRLGADELATLQAPVMMLWGSCDTFASVDKARQIADAMPDATLLTMEGASHLPWLGAEHECGARIREFTTA